MLTHILPIEENLCVFNEGASPMDPNCAVEKLSASLQLCEPFCITDSKSLVAPDISRTDVIVGALNSIRIAESSEQKDNKDKDNVRSDDVSETKSADIVYLSPRRRTDCTSKSNQKMGTKKATRKCRKTVNKKLLLDAIFLNVARKRRSGFCKRARSSTWGLLGNIAQFFEQNVGLDVNRTMHKKSRKSRSGWGGGKRNKSQTGQSSQKFNGESIVSTSHIRLKIKLGKGIVQSCLMNSVPLIDNDLEKYWGTRIELPKLTKDIEGKLEEEVPMSTEFQCCSGNMDKKIWSSGASVLDVNIKDDYIAEKFAGNSADNHYGIPSHEEVEGLGVTVDNKCLDPGTSPDSKVPEAQIGGKVPEDLHDVLIPSEDCVAQGDVTSLSLPQMSSKKEEKTNKLCQAGICSVDGRLPISETINSTSLFEKCGLGEKMGDVSYSSEASISTTTRNASGNICSSEGVSTEPLPSSRVTDFGMSTETLKVESGAEVDQCSTINVGLESPESLISEKLVTCTIPKGRKIPESSRSKGVSKSKSKSRAEVSDSVSRRENACGQKGNQAKLVNKQQAKENGGGGEVVCKVDSYPETGNHTLDDCGETKTGCRSTTADISNLDMVPSRLGDQYVPPQNAWVCCDVCFKWRRIAAVLADSIEETNCKWICKDNVDKMFADCSIPQEKSNAEINAELEISDVSCEEDACDARLNSNQLGQKHSTVPQHSSWKLIKSNLFLHRNRKAQTIDEIMVCHCKAPLNGQLGCGNGCLNRMLNIECVKGTCPCGELCSNQQFQKRKYAKLKSFRCGKKGHGLQLLEDIPKGQFLIEYVGEVLDTQAYEARQREYASKAHKHFYFMTLNGNEVIDACAKGNLGRFINHSCEPNCRTEKWMVNGEVCIGIFAMRDIKKGEEMTFDYNYVRIFGAAAKKCVCGSSQCQGYIGGDPRNAEVIVQGDSDEEYPEPVMVCEDGNSNLENIISASSSFDGTEMQTAENLDKNNDEMDKPTTAVGHIKITKEMPSPGILLEHKDEIDNSVITVGHMVTTTENEDSMKKSSTGASKLEISLEMEGSLGLSPYSIQSIETSLPPDDGKSEIMPAAQQDLSVAAETTNISLCTVQRFEPRSPTTMLSKSLPDTVDIKRKPKPDTEVDKCVSKSRPRMKTSRSSSVKKGKSKHNAVHVNKPLEMNTKSHVVVPCRSKKLFEGSSNDHFEAVQEKLNELLDADGGISKRKDASGGYLKLLFLTAASGDRSNGEAIQSNRDLSMILGALLKTKSRMVLVDIINKNGLQMLHNIMKRYRREFNKIPILRKLLKVLEHLAVREILTLEHINRGPPCRGVESFRESILTLTEHTDKQVHQIARNFRDRWIRRPFKKNNRMDWNVGGMDFHRGSNSNRFSASLNQSCDRSGRPTEAIECVKQSVIPTTQVGAEGCSTSCSSSCVTNATKTRKRKSRWDQPGERNSGPRSPLHKEPRIQPILLQKSYSSSQPEIDEVVLDHSTALPAEEKICSIETNIADDGRNDIDEDLPPGFPHPLNGPLVPPFNASSTALSLQPKNGEQDDGRKNVDEDLPPGFPHPLSGSLVLPSNASSTAISLQPKNGDRDDERKNIDEDLPPGFPHPLNGPLVPPSTASSTAISLHPKSGDREKCPYDVVIGHPWEKFFPQLSVSYGIPLPVVEQFGTPRGETAESWVVAPGMPFHPFPPLPPYPREKINPPAAANSMTMHLPAGKDAQNCHNPVTYHSDRNTQSTSGANPQFSTNQHNFHRGRGSSNSLGRKFFGQEKWNNSKLRRPPWIRNRNGWGFMGKNSRKGFSSIGVGSGENRPQGPYSSEVSISEVSIGVERSGNSFYQYQQHQN